MRIGRVRLTRAPSAEVLTGCGGEGAGPAARPVSSPSAGSAAPPPLSSGRPNFIIATAPPATSAAHDATFIYSVDVQDGGSHDEIGLSFSRTRFLSIRNAPGKRGYAFAVKPMTSRGFSTLPLSVSCPLMRTPRSRTSVCNLLAKSQVGVLGHAVNLTLKLFPDRPLTYKSVHSSHLVPRTEQSFLS